MLCYDHENVSFFYNHSKKNISEQWHTKDVVVVSLGLLVSAFVIFTNILVMLAIFMNRRFHYPIYYLLGNLAAADLFAGISYMYLMFHTGPWTIKLSVQQWFVRQGLVDTSLTASVINLMAIALERHQTIFTMQLHSKMTNHRVVLLIVGIWLIAIVLGLVPSMGWNCLCDVQLCSNMAPLYSRSYLVFWAVLNLLTFTVMVAVYTRIFVYVRHKSRRMSQHTSQVKHKETVVNLMKTVVMILGCFVVCWTPGLVLLLLDGLCKSCKVLTYEKFFLVLAECNSFMNPIIYSYRDNDMRDTFKRLLCFPCVGWQQKDGQSGVRFNTLEQEVLSESDGTSAPAANHRSSTR
ncbi:lysophosphatidic acid receptor 1-A-like isoform X1 [Carassius auratus]|uniref:Lysophosphatidic acid receptor 1-A-like isoform X1 n=1 Tax=Carassius auratus TaxID=7957 RepID=A0A6P6N1X5_CARAU|nr:lysophosphatidic acid receptor 1-A-like isoform X1 [Carassius auratus]XP_026102967.1 lysophosphatidic acid receptor 1-A-like isoform X1 [Carassius auratus]XP_026102968.1 lysophosphatidic acid receptor 1-A-like isoform X1 [Carassius auratus]XP_026102969.1 lysophosphatidic acid receptor 1-A-like isoform X1 [Carassius auratus]XP_026102970.1 lysophosphatidic acid receptor 1-A-like isoform X1 [Carassius auratus]XP_026102971.1 lysophosphatidic acid receptor 1-A-like isoform X1 [Carassius auratus]